MNNTCMIHKRNFVYSEHRKDCSKYMDVVRFAMAIELDRLVQENNLLKEESRSTHDYKKQIGDLMNRLQQLLVENDILKRDNDKLKGRLNQANLKAQKLEGQDQDYQQEIQANKLENITGEDGDFDIDALKQKSRIIRQFSQRMDNQWKICLICQINLKRRRENMIIIQNCQTERIQKMYQTIWMNEEKLRKLVKELQTKLSDLQKELDALRKKSKELDDIERNWEMKIVAGSGIQGRLQQLISQQNTFDYEDKQIIF